MAFLVGKRDMAPARFRAPTKCVSRTRNLVRKFMFFNSGHLILLRTFPLLQQLTISDLCGKVAVNCKRLHFLRNDASKFFALLGCPLLAVLALKL